MTKNILTVILLLVLTACSTDYSYRLRPNPPLCNDLGKDCR